jgi:hypothetical protein
MHFPTARVDRQHWHRPRTVGLPEAASHLINVEPALARQHHCCQKLHAPRSFFIEGVDNRIAACKMAPSPRNWCPIRPVGQKLQEHSPPIPSKLRQISAEFFCVWRLIPRNSLTEARTPRQRCQAPAVTIDRPSELSQHTPLRRKAA